MRCRSELFRTKSSAKLRKFSVLSKFSKNEFYVNLKVFQNKNLNRTKSAVCGFCIPEKFSKRENCLLVVGHLFVKVVALGYGF